MARIRYTPDETATLGEAIYSERIRDRVEATNPGEFLVLDIVTGDYEVDPDDLIATKRALANHPEAVLYGLRIGSDAAYRLGGRFGILAS